MAAQIGGPFLPVPRGKGRTTANPLAPEPIPINMRDGLLTASNSTAQLGTNAYASVQHGTQDLFASSIPETQLNPNPEQTGDSGFVQYPSTSTNEEPSEDGVHPQPNGFPQVTPSPLFPATEQLHAASASVAALEAQLLASQQVFDRVQAEHVAQQEARQAAELSALKHREAALKAHLESQRAAVTAWTNHNAASRLPVPAPFHLPPVPFPPAPTPPVHSSFASTVPLHTGPAPVRAPARTPYLGIPPTPSTLMPLPPSILVSRSLPSPSPYPPPIPGPGTPHLQPSATSLSLMTAFTDLTAHETIYATHHGTAYIGTWPIKREAVIVGQILGVSTPAASVDDEMAQLQAYVARSANGDPTNPDSPEQTIVMVYHQLQGIRTKVQAFFTDLARLITSNQAARGCLVDYGVKAEERLQNLTTLNHDATGTSLVGGFRKDSLALTMKAIGNNTAKIGEGPAAPKTKKSSNYDRDRPAQSFCQSCRKSNVDHYARNCPRRPISPDRSRDRDRSPGPSRRDRGDVKDSGKSAQDDEAD